MHNKAITGFGFRMIAIIIKASVCVVSQTLALIIIAIMRKPNPIVVNYLTWIPFTIAIIISHPDVFAGL